MDVFQFYTSSADAAPGRGTGESLANPPDTYADLRKIPNWRRSLAEAYTKGTAPPPELLPLTQSAELWYAPPRKVKERAAALEELRAAAVAGTLRTRVQEAEMEEPTPEKAKKTRAKASPKPKKGGADEEAATTATATAVPEGVLAGAPVVEEPLMNPPDLEKSEKTSAVRFCPVCNYYLYLQVSSGENQGLSRLCRQCGFSEEDEKGGLVMEMMVQEKSDESHNILLNEFTRKDPRLPHIRGTIKCPEPGCDSNHGKKESDIIYIKYDAVNMLYLYICDICGFMWKSSR